VSATWNRTFVPSITGWPTTVIVIEGHGRHQGLGALVVRGHLVAAESDVHPVYGQRLGYVDRQRQLPCDDRSVDSHLGAPDFGTQRDGYGFGLERDRRVLGVARRFQVDILDHDIADRNLLARQSERKIAEFQLGQILTGAGQVDFLKRSPVVAQQRNFDAHVAFVHPDDLLAQVGRAAAVPAFVLAGTRTCPARRRLTVNKESFCSYNTF